MKHFAAIQREFEKHALDLIRLDGETSVKLEGLPFRVTEDSDVIKKLKEEDDNKPVGVKSMEPKVSDRIDDKSIDEKSKNESCPICHERYESKHDDKFGDFKCSNGHEWHLCPVHNKRVMGHSHDKSMFGECTCPKPGDPGYSDFFATNLNGRIGPLLKDNRQ